jgi:hypothetical protein
MAALPPAVLTYGHPSPLVPVLGGALPSSPQRDERSQKLSHWNDDGGVGR